MADDNADLRIQLARQVAHWTMAAARLEDLESLASRESWAGLERYLRSRVRSSLLEAIDRLNRRGRTLRAALGVARSGEELAEVYLALEDFKRRYFRTETLLDFYTDAIKTRTMPEVSALLRACDVLTRKSMTELLEQLGKTAPQVLTYLDKGLGANIVKANLRLWDGTTENPAAAIKIAWHNLYRPTSLIHEAGHQVAYICGWNDELAAALDDGLSPGSKKIGEAWASWASEVAADTFAFVHTGYASVAALHDILAGEDDRVFMYIPYDPHPIRYLRVLLGAEMCTQFFGAGPWDGLARAWRETHLLERVISENRDLIERSVPLIPKVVDVCLRKPMRAFNGRPLSRLIKPERVRPTSLFHLEEQVGPSLYTSRHWIWTEPVRLLALTGYRAATLPERAREILNQQRSWMLTLGASLEAAA